MMVNSNLKFHTGLAKYLPLYPENQFDKKKKFSFLLKIKFYFILKIKSISF